MSPKLLLETPRLFFRCYLSFPAKKLLGRAAGPSTVCPGPRPAGGHPGFPPGSTGTAVQPSPWGWGQGRWWGAGAASAPTGERISSR